VSNRETAQPLIIRRSIKREAAHHGGAWKVAYADFVTAMMAFFLLMWLLNATSEEQRKGIADYFDPTLPISRTSAGGTGMLSGDSIFSTSSLAAMKDHGVRRRPNDPSADPDGASEVGPTHEQSQAPQSDDLAARTPEPTRPLHDARAEEELERQIEAALEAIDDPTIRRHFRLRVTPEGLVIEIVDLSERPLFPAGSSEPSAVLRTLLSILVPLVEETTNDIAIVGHTDSLPYGGGGAYTNWELSTDRANAARRLMATLGLARSRIARVSGMADTDPFDVDPSAAQNRRIAVVLLRETRR